MEWDWTFTSFSDYNLLLREGGHGNQTKSYGDGGVATGSGGGYHWKHLVTYGGLGVMVVSLLTQNDSSTHILLFQMHMSFIFHQQQKQTAGMRTCSPGWRKRRRGIHHSPASATD